MYADTGVFFPCMQNFGQDMQQLEVYCKSQKPNFSMSNLVQASTIAEYDLGAEGDLFKAPEPIIEEPGVGLDPMTAAMTIIPCSEDVIASQVLKAVDIESIQNEQLLREVLYECEKDLMATAAIETPLSEVLDIKIPVAKNDENQNQENKVIPDIAFQKSVSSSCLSSMDWMQGPAMKPNFLDFPGMDFAAYGMRRAYSEGDIKTLGNDNMSLIPSRAWPLVISSCCSEDRKEKLSRYRNKKKKRNFGRKIKYACRKALADSQPRIRGRFAKTEESDTSKRQLLN